MLKERLIKLIIEKGFDYSEEPVFDLSDGTKSDCFFNLKNVILDPYGISLISEMVMNSLTRSYDAIGGPELGAIPIIGSLITLSYMKMFPLRGFIIRKNCCGQDKNTIEGNLQEGDRAILIEDIMTTGSSILYSIDQIEKAGAKVSKIISIIDREEKSTRRLIMNKCIYIDPLIKKSEIIEEYKRLRDNMRI